MTTAAENEILTRVGPGTPMGELMRQYWVPALQSSELKADGDPVRFKILGEELIAFRDTSGRIGVMDHRCPHRCASLFFGRNEEGGIRCVYHGWKFDVDGNCTDMANVPPHQDFKQKVHAKAYKAAERAGLIWVYMGDPKNVPELPPIETSLLPSEIVSVQMHLRNCNWLQALEGELDTSHVGLLHYGSVGVQNFQADGIRKYSVTSRAPEYRATETDAGFMYGAYRPADKGKRYWRIAHFLFPFWAMPPINAIEINFLARAYVPVDDEHTMSTYIILKGTEPTRREATGRNIPGATLDLDYLPNTTDFLGRYRLATNAENDYRIDREKQRTISYTGINGITLQDHAITESMGAITDRTFEHLAPSDMMINRVRRLLVKAATDFQKTGKAPKSATDPKVYDGLRGGQFVAPEGQDWLEAWRENLERTPLSSAPALAQAAE
jgi:phthalate 4,5-dioxygenase oxygenase subunit